MNPIDMGIARASPSLALVKYWGKSDNSANLPATPSIAVTLEKLVSETRVWALRRSAINGHIGDMVLLDGEIQKPGRFEAYFEGLRRAVGKDFVFWAESTNNFPTAAGLASSSSGFAALSIAACASAGFNADAESLSSIARLGSGSAARSLFGGFTLLPADSESAEQLHPREFWPELRIVVARVQDGAKDLSSREAMERTRLSSPYYDAWVADAQKICAEARAALAKKDIEALGTCIRLSYMRMFATMFGASPPVLYWKPESLAVVHVCEELRKKGIAAWETMDAGPQVKIFSTAADAGAVAAAVEEVLGKSRTVTDSVGEGPAIPDTVELLPGYLPEEFLAQAKKLGVTLPSGPAKNIDG